MRFKLLLTVLCAILLFGMNSHTAQAKQSSNEIQEIARDAAKTSKFGPFTEDDCYKYIMGLFNGQYQSDLKTPSQLYGRAPQQIFNISSFPKSLQQYHFNKEIKGFFIIQHHGGVKLGNTPISFAYVTNFSGPETYILAIEANLPDKYVPEEVIQSLASKYGQDGIVQYDAATIRERYSNAPASFKPTTYYYKETDDYIITFYYTTNWDVSAGRPICELLYLNKKTLALALAKNQEQMQKNEADTQQQRQKDLNAF
ncbi:exported hypothetical protein [uncultured delta proteobacterium]|uniref:Uncharacterized protein n=1 Tax=uncultured delta proteobacterium TaxID=34034 RepID=A0A212KG55_9DELT|nr:exported hypothetical protein [uncultured delta proteobacterium]SBW10683.1 exported hypothetical protein [uncultured delta proteobacterium]